MPHDLPFEPHDFDPFAGFTGGEDAVQDPGSATFHPAADLFDPSGMALQFGPPPVGGVDGLGDLSGHESHDVNWYDAPHHW